MKLKIFSLLVWTFFTGLLIGIGLGNGMLLEKGAKILEKLPEKGTAGQHAEPSNVPENEFKMTSDDRDLYDGLHYLYEREGQFILPNSVRTPGQNESAAENPVAINGRNSAIKKLRHQLIETGFQSEKIRGVMPDSIQPAIAGSPFIFWFIGGIAFIIYLTAVIYHRQKRIESEYRKFQNSAAKNNRQSDDESNKKSGADNSDDNINQLREVIHS